MKMTVCLFVSSHFNVLATANYFDICDQNIDMRIFLKSTLILKQILLSLYFKYNKLNKTHFSDCYLTENYMAPYSKNIALTVKSLCTQSRLIGLILELLKTTNYM